VNGDDAQHSLGDLWRLVVNFLGDAPVTPALFLPLLEHVAPRWSEADSLVKWVKGHLDDPKDRAEVEDEIAATAIGWRLWSEERDRLALWAGKGKEGPLSAEDIEDWWLNGDRRLTVDEQARLTQFVRIMRFEPSEAALIEAKMASFERPVVIHRLHQHLGLIWELEAIRRLARKTWPADPKDRRGWDEDELDWINAYFAQQETVLVADERDGAFHPFELETVRYEGGVGIGLDGFGYCRLVLIRAVVIDFAEELLEASRMPSVRGSLRCVECGSFVGRRALGYGQLYCTDRCKKRAAKRRSRRRSRATAA
jgi:hypothetical protein